jgi:biopolymer transport protein ExbD
MSSVARYTRYHIRSLWVLTTVVAIVLGFLRLRPSPVIRVDLSADGSVAIAGQGVAQEAMQKRLEAELASRRRWLMDGSVVIAADREASFKAFSAVVENPGLAGCSKVTIMAK